MQISGEFKVGTALGLVGIAGVGVPMVFPESAWLGWLFIAFAVIGFVVLSYLHFRPSHPKTAVWSTVGAILIVCFLAFLVVRKSEHEHSNPSIPKQKIETDRSLDDSSSTTFYIRTELFLDQTTKDSYDYHVAITNPNKFVVGIDIVQWSVFGGSRGSLRFEDKLISPEQTISILSVPFMGLKHESLFEFDVQYSTLSEKPRHCVVHYQFHLPTTPTLNVPMYPTSSKVTPGPFKEITPEELKEAFEKPVGTFIGVLRRDPNDNKPLYVDIRGGLRRIFIDEVTASIRFSSSFPDGTSKSLHSRLDNTSEHIISLDWNDANDTINLEDDTAEEVFKSALQPTPRSLQP